MRVGVVVGLAAEARIARRLGPRVAIGGGTAARAATAAERLVDGGSEALVSFGLACGLDPALRAGALVVPSAVIVDGVRHCTDPELSRLLGGATAHAVLGADAIVTGIEDKQRLRHGSSAAAADMECGAVARIASSHRLPFAVLRAICDPAELPLPPAALSALNAHGKIIVRHVVASLIAQPAQLPALLTLAMAAAAARRALAARVNQIVQAPS
jgi:adenosylhomocysteine nucleosidase